MAAKKAKRLVLEGELTISTAAVTKPRLIDALKKTKELIIDLSGVCEIDTAGLQLLLLAKREADTAGACVTLFEASEQVRDLIAFSGLSDYLDTARA